MGTFSAKQMNVCGIRRKRLPPRWWQCNNKHGAGWAPRIRQAWTYREACNEVRRMFESGLIGADDVEVIELVPRSTAKERKISK